MRPTAEEQLSGTCRVLESVVLPAVADPYARTLLAGLIGNLRMLGGALPAVNGFLRDDNQATAALLEQMRASVAPELSESIATALSAPAPDAADRAALDARNGVLRELLSHALLDEDLPAAARQAALAHLTQRAARAPMRYVSTTTPAPKTAN